MYLFHKHGRKPFEVKFSSPFIEERLYFQTRNYENQQGQRVLVPFYRGAVVFFLSMKKIVRESLFSSPFIEERLYFRKENDSIPFGQFSSPFIEERLYFYDESESGFMETASSRPLLSRSGCI